MKQTFQLWKWDDINFIHVNLKETVNYVIVCQNNFRYKFMFTSAIL